jgi:hypothetical protein
VTLGTSTGHCGYLLTQPRRVFPFTPSRGTWTFQYDTRPSYLRDPGAPVSRETVKVL